MIKFVLPSEENENDVLRFYSEFKAAGQSCIGSAFCTSYADWLSHMRNRKTGKNLPDGFVRENFYLCYDCENDRKELLGVFSIKFELTPYLADYGGHIGYAVSPSKRNRGYATEILKIGIKLAKDFGIGELLLVCDEDNIASEKVILKNGGVFENKKFDPEENVFVKRFSITV